MAGATFEIKSNSDEVQGLINQLEKKLGNLTPALRDIAEHLQNSTQQRFVDQVAPDGTPWAKLQPSYQRIKPKHKDRILFLEGELEKNFNSAINNNELKFGTNIPYAAHHQFGTKPYTITPKSKKALAFGGVVVKKVNHPGLPARPFLGLSSADNEEILRLLSEHLQL
jgi:phage virion morphogenesis protein